MDRGNVRRTIFEGTKKKKINGNQNIVNTFEGKYSPHKERRRGVHHICVFAFHSDLTKIIS